MCGPASVQSKGMSYGETFCGPTCRGGTFGVLFVPQDEMLIAGSSGIGGDRDASGFEDDRGRVAGQGGVAGLGGRGTGGARDARANIPWSAGFGAAGLAGFGCITVGSGRGGGASGADRIRQPSSSYSVSIAVRAVGLGPAP